MAIFRRIRKFFALPARDRALFVEAVFSLGTMRRALKRRPFRELVAGLERHPGALAASGSSTTDAVTAQAIGRAVQSAATVTPWESACLVQALAAQRMLQKRGIAGVFYLGATTPSKAVDSEMAAHAWLMCGDAIITGEAGHERFTVVSTFSWS